MVIAPEYRQLPGLHRLDDKCSLNGVEGTILAAHHGRDAAAGGWPGTGGTLTLAGSGTEPVYGVATELKGPRDGGVTFAPDKYFSGGTSLGNAGTNDLVVEVAGLMSNGAFFVNKELAASITGWGVYQSAQKLVLRTFKGSSTTKLTVSLAVTLGAPFYASVCLNKDEASTNCSQWAVNGANSGAGVDHSTNGDLDSTGLYTVGARSGGLSNWDGTIWSCRVWTKASWLRAGADGVADHLAWHQHRWRLLTNGLERFGII